ncbi:unnamed protein product, partial [Symbiodinium sp. CCMP2592]
AAEGSRENREQIAQLQASVGELQSQGVHQGQKLFSLSTEHDRTMSLLAEFESSMKDTWGKAVQRLSTLEGSFENVLAAQAVMREDCEGWLDKSAEEQKQHLVVMLERQAATLEALSRKQIASDEQIVQLKQGLDKAQAEAVAVNNKYEQNLERTRWVVTKVAELEGLVAKLRQRDVSIQREMGVGKGLTDLASSSSQRNAVGSAATLSGPLYYAMTPDLPAAQEDDEHDDGGDGWWGDEREWVSKDLETSVPPGLSFGPCTPPPPLPPDMKKSEGIERQTFRINQAAYKLIKDAPKLDLSAGGEPWEVGMTAHQWRVETRTVLAAIHPGFADYFDRIYEEGRQRYEKKRLTGFEDSLPDITVAEAEMETRLSLALLKNLPQTVRQPVVEGSTSKNVRCILMFESLHERYAPGGREELESIQRYLRQLPSAQDFKGAMTTLRRWKLARHRAQSVGLPEQAPNEGIAALDSLMKVLEKKHQQLAMKINLLRMQPDIIIPATSGLDRLEMLELLKVARWSLLRRRRQKGWDIRTCFGLCEGESNLSDAGPVDSSDSTGRAIESESESEGHGRPPLWYLVLHEVEYALMSSGASPLLTHAIAPFQQVNGPNLIAVGIWEILEELDFQLPIEDIQIGCEEGHADSAVFCGPQVLVDSGANEVIRPRPEGYDVHRCKKTQVALASGDTVQAWRTRDGELMIGDVELDHDADWILSVRRLRGIRGAFVWDELGPRVKYWNGENQVTVHCMEQNGLPYISWEDFKPIRVLLAKDWRKRGNISVMRAETSSLHVTDYEPTVEILGSRFQEESKIAPAVALEDAGEQRAKELCAKAKITFDEVWDAIQLASLVERKTDRERVVEEGGKKALPMWSFGLFVHGGVLGVTSETRRHPWLTRLLTKLVRQHHPDLEFLSVGVGINLAFRPHRDRNSLERESVLFGITRFIGGQLWIEGLPNEKGNTAIRRVDSSDEPKAGRLHELSHKSVRFNSALRLHGTEPFKGTRATAVGYTPRGHLNVTAELMKELSTLGFHDERMQKLGDQVCSEGDAVQIEPNGEPGSQDVWDSEFQGLGTSSVQSPGDDGDEGLSAPGLMAFEAVAEEVIDLTGDPPARPGHALKDYEARGLRRPHRKVTADQVSRGVLSIDLAGPYAAAYDGTKYALIAVFRIDESMQLHFVRPMKRRLWSELFSALQSVLAQVSALCGDRPQVVRIHSDKAREFLAQRVVEGINALGVFQTTTTGYDPQANGLAERTVGLLKERARGFLIRGGINKKFWPLMMAEAARRQRDVTLNRPHQGRLPEPGDYVAVTVQGAGPFDPRVEPGRFIAQSDVAVQGALVLVTRAGQEHLITARLPAVIDKKPEQWRTHVTPLGDLVWISSSGQVRDGEVVRDLGVDLGMLTVEEREQGGHVEQGLPFVARASAGNHLEEEPLAMVPEVRKKVKNDDKADRYQILPYEVEQEMNRAEVKVAQLVTDTIDARILSDPKTPADEKLKWINEGLKPELQTLQQKGIYDEWDEADIPSGAKVLPSKVVLTKKPLDNDAEVDPAEPLSTWRAKARIVVCGNYEQNTVGHDPDNASANPAIEHIRWSATCLASNPSWTGLVLDVTAAFLNAKMDNDAEGTTFFLDPVSSGVWAIRKQGEPQSFFGAFDMYVDDGLIVGPVSLCQALAEVLLKTWQMKIQGFLPSDGLKVGEKVQVGDKQVPIRQELQFLEMVIRRTEEGVSLHQHPWVETELERRGWAAVKGAANLPEVVEGQTVPVTRDDAYGADLHRAQSEIGSLFWLGLRTRPDLLATVGALSCMSTVDPRKTYKLATQVWRYVAGTRDKVLFFRAGGNLQEEKLSIFGDASLAPGASRSRTGVVVKLGGYTIAYRTQRQSLTAYSAFEAEVEAAATAYQLGTQVKLFVDKFLKKDVETELFGDNSACVSNLTKGSEYVQPTRTRHFGMRCSYLRDHLKNDGIPMLHMSGELIPADGLTKTLSRVKLESSRGKLNVV